MAATSLCITTPRQTCWTQSRQEQDLVFKELDCRLFLHILDPRENADAMRWMNYWGLPLQEFRRQLKSELREEVMLLWQ